METKKGISLVVLVITIVVISLITGIIISQTDNIIFDAQKSEFATEISTIEGKIKEYYLLMGALPVRPGIEYTAEDIKNMHANASYKQALESEIGINDDENNVFQVVDLDIMQIKTKERGLGKDNVDIFLVATNTLNVYYLKGSVIEEDVLFSLATFPGENLVQSNEQQTNTQVELDGRLVVSKNTNVWTNEIVLTVRNKLKPTESLQYNISGAEAKTVVNNIIKINQNNMTEQEKINLNSSKKIRIDKIVDESVVETKEVTIENLDVEQPVLAEIEVVDTSNANYNVIRINSSDKGGSDIKSVYYDCLTKMVNGEEVAYYVDRSNISSKELVNFGKITNDGIIELDKSINSIVAVAIDNAGNISELKTYDIQ